MSFDDLFGVELEEPEPEPPVEHELPEWHGPPSGELPVAVPLGLILARSERGVVAVSHALVHSSGLQFDLVAQVTGLQPAESNMIFHEQHAVRMGTAELPKGFLRFGIELADGRRVSNLAQPWRRPTPEQGPTGPVLMQAGSSGGGSSTGTGAQWSSGYWLWPLQTAGILRLYCEWPVAEIGLTSIEVDAAPFLEAAANVRRLWPAEAETSGPWTRTVSRTSTSQTVFVAGDERDGADADPRPERAAVLVSELAPPRAAL